jgi:alkylation response protein AidB-like acyl-CoA dehydrogenase
MVMVAESSGGVLDEVRRIVERDLVPIAAKIDIEGHYPEGVLRAIGAAGGLGLHLPSQQADRACHMARSIESMAIAGETCLSTAFLMWCQSACGWYLENSENGALRAEILPRVATGEILGGTALSNPMKFLSGIEPLQLVGTRVPGGYRLRGQLPWVSNLGAGHVFGLVFRVEDGRAGGPDDGRADRPDDRRDGREVMALVSCDAEGLTLTQGAHFTALEGTRTFALRFDDVFVPEERLLADPAGPYLARIKAGFILMQTGMAIGLVAGCIDIMQRADRSLSHVNCFLDERPEMFEAELAGLRADVHHLGATPWERDPGYLRQVLEARLRAGEMSIRAASAALLHAGARGYLVRAPAQRRLREAYFVAILTPAIKHLRKELASMAA